MAPTQAPPLPPGPSGLPLVGTIPEIIRDTTATFINGWRRYGDVVRFPLMGSLSGVLVAHPDHVKWVLVDNAHNYRKAPHDVAAFSETLGNGLFTSEGDFWLRQRRIMQPAFHRERIQSFGAIMTSVTESMLARWESRLAPGEVFDVMPELRRLVMTIVARSLFSSSVEGEVEEIARAVQVLVRWVNRRLYWTIDPIGALPLPPRRQYQAAMQTLDRLVFRFIDEHRQSGEDQGDLLAMLLHARDPETGQGMTDQQLRDEVLTIFLAGIDTTVNAIGWSWWLLSHNAESGRHLRSELRDVLGGRTPTTADLPSLRYNEMILNEALRLYPPAWAMSRVATEDDEIGGYRIPAGNLVYVSQYVTHRHPEFWENPEGFDPERFSPERSAKRPRFAYFPFGGGPRQCIGNAFALVEAQLITATVLQRYHLDLAPGFPVRPRIQISLRPDPGLFMTLRPA